MIDRAEPVSKEWRLQTLRRQVDRLNRRLLGLRRTSTRYTWLRVAVVVFGLLAATLAWQFVFLWLALACLVSTVLAFGLAVYAHRRVERSIERHEILRRHTLAQVSRANLNWEGLPLGFHHRSRPEHPFEADLDLVGPRSLHRLMDTAVSYEGSQRLRDWLTSLAPDPAQITRRQDLVRELVPLSLFRNKLVLNATEAAGAQRNWRANQLVEWLHQPTPQASLRGWLVLLAILAVLNAGLFAANMLGVLPPWWRVTFVIYLALTLIHARSGDAAWDQAADLEGALRQLGQVFRQLETFSYHRTPNLGTLCAPFVDVSHQPSRYLARLNRVLTAMGLRGNPMVRVALNALCPWDVYFAYRLDLTRAGLAAHAPAWMDAWFELEALGSLANFAYLNPHTTFPSVRQQEEQRPAQVFRAERLGHPLLPGGERVCNDFAMARLGQVAVITGSNMAGKSVFLKTVGVNLALAYAGGPVNAQSLETLPFRLYTCMGISDSVTNGISYFYAEVRRLKALLAELERQPGLPLFFCIDEIFRGTNNRERLLGSRAYIRALVGKKGAGLIATHDLELTKLARELDGVDNYHFRDDVVEGRMAFDYVLRRGPSPTTNALQIMQLEGLPVPLEEDVP